MVCSQVYSQRPSQTVPANAQPHRYWDPNNTEVYCLEPETMQGKWLGNSVCDGNVWPSKVNACSGPANTPSSFKSSWIQRLIPSHGTRAEQPQITENLISESHGIDAVQIDWKENATYPPIMGNKSDFPLYENSRSKQDFFSCHQTYLDSDTTRGAHNGVNIAATSRRVEPSEALQPEVQVFPKQLPIVESLLPGASKRIFDNQISTETNKPHILSKCTVFSNHINQTVHYSADERSRVSCSSIQGMNSRSAVCAAEDLLAFKSMQGGKSCFNLSQPNLEFPLNSADAVTMSNMDSVYAGKDWRTSTNLSRTYMNPLHTVDPFTNLHTEDRYPVSHANWASSVVRCRSTENRLVDGHLMPYRAEGIKPYTECFAQASHSTSKTDERLGIGVSMDRTTCPKTMGIRDCWHAMEHQNYEVGDSCTVEALNARGGAFDGGGGLLIPNMRKDGLQRVSNLDLSQNGANVAKERASISVSDHVTEQDLSLTHDSNEEQGGMSRSFSFQFANQLSYDPDHARVVMRKGNWPFCPTSVSSEDLVQSRCPVDSRSRDMAETSRSGISLKNSSTFQEIGTHETGMVCIGRSRCSPFFGTENLTESARHELYSVKDDNSPYKASCIDIKEVFLGGMNTQALCGNGVAQAGGIEQGKARSLRGGHAFSRFETDLMIKATEWKELKYAHPFRTVSVNNWDPSSRSTIHTFPPVGAQLKQADGSLCYSTSSIGSCSKCSANRCTEKPSTAVEARYRHTPHKKLEASTPVAIKGHLYRSKTQSASNGLNVVRDGQDYEGRDEVGGEGSGLKKNMWLRRWSTTRSREGLDVCKANRERTFFADMAPTRKGYSTSQGIKESSHCFDLRPAKRICWEERSGLQAEPGKETSKFSSIAMGRKHSKSGGVASHFMKRFLTPSAAAMAVMGMTARQVHATQPQGSGLFGAWTVNASTRSTLPAAPPA
eukprot:c3421_g1_i1 orf=495-3335(+)